MCSHDVQIYIRRRRDALRVEGVPDRLASDSGPQHHLLEMTTPAKLALLLAWATSTVAIQPWLNASLPYEERLQAFIAQLNNTQKFAMVQGDTVVSVLPRDLPRAETSKP